MKISYRLGLRDRMAFVREAMHRSPYLAEVMNAQRRYSVLLVAGIGVVTGLSARSWAPFFTCLILGAAYYAFFPDSFFKAYLRGAERQQELAGAVCMDAEHHLELSERGIHSARPAGESLYSWKLVADVTESPTHVFVHFRTTSGLAIPKATVTGGDLPAFRQAMAGHIVA